MTLVADTYAYTGHRYDDEPPSMLEQVQDMAGRYCSAELRSAFQLYVQDDILFFQQQTAPPIQLFPAPKESNISWNGIDRVWTGAFMLKKTKTPNGDAVGFDIGDGRVSGVAFQRCDPQQTSIPE